VENSLPQVSIGAHIITCTRYLNVLIKSMLSCICLSGGYPSYSSASTEQKLDALIKSVNALLDNQKRISDNQRRILDDQRKISDNQIATQHDVDESWKAM